MAAAEETQEAPLQLAPRFVYPVKLCISAQGLPEDGGTTETFCTVTLQHEERGAELLSERRETCRAAGPSPVFCGPDEPFELWVMPSPASTTHLCEVVVPLQEVLLTARMAHEFSFPVSGGGTLTVAAAIGQPQRGTWHLALKHDVTGTLILDHNEDEVFVVEPVAPKAASRRCSLSAPTSPAGIPSKLEKKSPGIPLAHGVSLPSTPSHSPLAGSPLPHSGLLHGRSFAATPSPRTTLTPRMSILSSCKTLGDSSELQLHGPDPRTLSGERRSVSRAARGSLMRRTSSRNRSFTRVSSQTRVTPVAKALGSGAPVLEFDLRQVNGIERGEVVACCIALGELLEIRTRAIDGSLQPPASRSGSRTVSRQTSYANTGGNIRAMLGHSLSGNKASLERTHSGGSLGSARHSHAGDGIAEPCEMALELTEAHVGEAAALVCLAYALYALTSAALRPATGSLVSNLSGAFNDLPLEKVTLLPRVLHTDLLKRRPTISPRQSAARFDGLDGNNRSTSPSRTTSTPADWLLQANGPFHTPNGSWPGIHPGANPKSWRATRDRELPGLITSAIDEEVPVTALKVAGPAAGEAPTAGDAAARVDAPVAVAVAVIAGVDAPAAEHCDGGMAQLPIVPAANHIEGSAHGKQAPSA
ncbi:hypothetical protein WJX72_007811 [[Myrmecia] bisecta]|uniref:C2 domain-containing protein n=1 Tax=[Myrmecia] bisecta TaxID=41462 RepID=A0AAW1Q736_9CHLO